MASSLPVGVVVAAVCRCWRRPFQRRRGNTCAVFLANDALSLHFPATSISLAAVLPRPLPPLASKRSPFAPSVALFVGLQGNAKGWHVCASGENEECKCSGTVVYGRKFVAGKPGSGALASIVDMTKSKFKEKAVTGSIKCSYKVFGDPLRGFYKHCMCNDGLGPGNCCALTATPRACA